MALHFRTANAASRTLWWVRLAAFAVGPANAFVAWVPPGTNLDPTRRGIRQTSVVRFMLFIELLLRPVGTLRW